MKARNKSPVEVIKASVGSLLFVYYVYVDKFHGRAPVDLEDLIDGLSYVDAVQFIQEQERDKMEAEARAKAGR